MRHKFPIQIEEDGLTMHNSNSRRWIDNKKPQLPDKEEDEQTMKSKEKKFGEGFVFGKKELGVSFERMGRINI